MSQYRLRVLVCAWVVCGLFCQACYAGPMQLTIYVNLDARQFLISSNQKIIIVLPDPMSEGGTAVVAAATLQPIADSTTLIFDSDSALYVTSGPVAPLGVLTMGVTNPMVYGSAYSFNGVQINGNGSGLSGYVSIYYEAPLSSQPVVTGLAEFIYESATGKPQTPSPINYYTLNPFETQYIEQPTPVVWAFVASDISTGSVLPLSILTPVSPSSSRAKALLESNSSFQIGRYLAVTLSSSNQASIHFDSSINAFVDGPYPETK